MNVTQSHLCSHVVNGRVGRLWTFPKAGSVVTYSYSDNCALLADDLSLSFVVLVIVVVLAESHDAK